MAVTERDVLGRTNANFTRQRNTKLAVGSQAGAVADAVDHLDPSGRLSNLAKYDWRDTVTRVGVGACV